MSIRTHSIALLACLAVTWSARAGAEAEFIPIGEDLDVRDLSRDGSVVVGSTAGGLGGPETQAFRWTEEGGLEVIGPLAGDESSRAYGCSPDGRVVVGHSYGSRDGVFWERAFRWTAETGIEALADVHPFFSYRSLAADVSANGVIALYAAVNPLFCSDPDLHPLSCLGRAFVWTESEGLQPVGSGEQSGVSSISDDGRVVAGQVGSGPTYGYQVRLDTGVETLIPNPFDAQGFFLFSHLSADGEIVYGLADGHVRWSEARGYEGPEETAGGSFTWGGVPLTADREAFLGYEDRHLVWDAAGGLRDLEALLTEGYQLELGDWTFESMPLGAGRISPRMVSADGRTLVGRQFGDEAYGYGSETALIRLPPACSDLLDGDGDGLVDHPEDPGCLSPNDPSERMRCGDGLAVACLPPLAVFFCRRPRRRRSR